MAFVSQVNRLTGHLAVLEADLLRHCRGLSVMSALVVLVPGRSFLRLCIL